MPDDTDGFGIDVRPGAQEVHTGSDVCGKIEPRGAYVAARPVQAIALDDAAFIRAVLGPNSTDDHTRFGAELVPSLGRAIRKGYFAACTNDVERLSGRPARTLQEVVDAGLHPARA
jgi:hypothetical protein